VENVLRINDYNLIRMKVELTRRVTPVFESTPPRRQSEQDSEKDKNKENLPNPKPAVERRKSKDQGKGVNLDFEA